MKSVSDILFSIENKTHQKDNTFRLKNDIFIDYPIIDKATIEAINQTSGCTGFELWQQINKVNLNQFEFKEVKTMFLKDNSYRKCSVLVYDGEDAHTNFNDEIGTKKALEGKFSTTQDFILLDSIGNTILDRTHFDTLYIFNPSVHKIWINNKNGGQEQWIDMALLPTFMIGKETPQSLYLSTVYPTGGYFMLWGDVRQPEFFFKKRSNM